MDTATRHPLERAADGALEKAEKMGGHTAAHWNPDTEDWSVHSATDPNTVYRVWRKNPDGPAAEQSERQQQANRGWWWFTLECNCPAITTSGYAVCKHKACVRLWQLHYQRRDGRAWGTLPAHSNRMAQANADLDAEGVERYKDKPHTALAADIYCDCPDDPCREVGCPCEDCYTDSEGWSHPINPKAVVRDPAAIVELPW
jgi:hypothetical protein